MHSIEAIIALLLLFSFFGIILTTISIQENYFFKYKENEENYLNAIACATIIDFVFSNSINSANISNCFGEENNIFVKNSKNTIKIITNIKNDNFTGIEINEHYIK
jgi:hypothetical protein